MPLSHYIKTYPANNSTDDIILFSTKTASSVRLCPKTFQAVKKNRASPSDMKVLEDLEMAVSDLKKERESVLESINVQNNHDSVLHLIVALNLDCNFACPYCFEEGIKGKYYLTDATENNLIKFIKTKFTRNKKTLLIDFYGGEPLLSTDLIKSISKRLIPFIKTKKGNYYFTLISNGSLFTRKVAEELVPCGLKSIKITIDGPSEVHNKSRPFKSGGGSFDQIIKNIQQTWDLVEISIGGNYNTSNYGEFISLLDYLKDNDLGPDKIAGIKFDPIINTPKEKMETCHKVGCSSINDPWLINAGNHLREEILKRGYFTPPVAPIVCMLELDNAFVINFDGRIYKCPAFIGRDKFCIGDLQTGTKGSLDSYKTGIWKNKECIECKYLPLCFGGCTYMSFVKNGHTGAMDCRKDYFDASLETMVKQDIKYMQGSL